MRFDIVSVLPEIFTGFLQYGVCGRALQNGLARAEFWNPRDYAKDKRRTVDDRPFGGGSGMVLLAEPLAAAVDAAKQNNAGEVVYLAPRGELLSDSMARELAARDGLILLCGRYRGVDERVVESRAARCISAGDYVLSGGEVAAMALMESVLRHRPGVLGNADSADEDAFAGGLLDAPCYTRPAVWQNRKAPPALLSGDHAAAREWRRTAAEDLTRNCRPDLWARHKK
ncbi:MAG: tRNA (guanosine(37)-N1)-methyltransferase TrmD [Gammaproteobacteria bacterium]